MAGKQPSKEQIRVALGIYLANTPGIESVYDEHTDTYHLKDANGKEATIGPGWHCEDATLRDAVGGILMDMLQGEPDHTSAPKPAQKTVERANVPAVPRKSSDDFDMSDWRQKQAKTYNVAGKTAPNAFALSEEANKRGLCTQIIDAGRSKDLVWGHVRVTDPKTGQFREDRVSHEKETFVLLKAWEDANSQAKWTKGLIIGVQDNNMPELDPQARIKGMPASLWLTMQVMRSWSMADRDAVTKAERRAQLKIMNRDWREDGEIALEAEEEQAVRESIDRQRATA